MNTKTTPAASARALTADSLPGDQPGLSSYRLFAPGDEFKLALTLGSNLPKSVSGQPAAYFWKDVIASGHYKHPTRQFSLTVDRQRIRQWAETGKKMLRAGVAIPINCDHSDSARDCVGYVKDFKVDGDRLLALCQLIGNDAPLLAARNQVSAGIVPDFTDGENRRWGDAIVHVALTPVPVVSGQDSFVQAASLLAEKQEVLLLTTAQPAERNLLLPCSAACLEMLHHCVPSLKDAAPDQKLAKLGEHLKLTSEKLSQADQKLAAKENELASMTTHLSRPLDPAAQDAILESLETKLDIAFSRGSIDKLTRQKLIDLLGKNSRGEVSTLLLSRAAGSGAAKPLALMIAEILLSNKPIASGEATALQTLSRAIPGEAETAVLTEFNKYMTQVANRR